MPGAIERWAFVKERTATHGEFFLRRQARPKEMLIDLDAMRAEWPQARRGSVWRRGQALQGADQCGRPHGRYDALKPAVYQKGVADKCSQNQQPSSM
jgi:hypothetical protein